MAFASIPEETLQKYMKTPVGKPPPGFKSLDPDAPDPLLATYQAISALTVILTTIFIGVRMYTRGIVLKNLWWDDCTFIACFLFDIAETCRRCIITGMGEPIPTLQYLLFAMLKNSC